MNPKIKIIFSDVDGTLTDGKLYYGPNGEAFKAFNVHDGMGIKRWQDSARIFGIVSAKGSKILKQRAKDLRVKELGMNVANKLDWISNSLLKLGFSWQQTAYIGDDLNDLAALKKAAVSACPSNAVQDIHSICNYVCQNKGGEGAVREFIDKLLLAE